MTCTVTPLSQRRMNPAEQVGAAATSDISNHSVTRAAEQYWIVSCEDEELRFSLRSAAEKWVAALEAKGLSVELSFHDHAAPVAPTRVTC